VRSIVYGFNVSLDGYIEDKNGSIDFSGPDEELHRWYNDLELEYDTHLYGRGLWEVMGDYWNNADKDPDADDVTREYAVRWQKSKNVVVSRTLTNVPGAEIIKNNVVERVKALKEEPGKKIAVGGAMLAQSLMQEGLIDEVMVMVYPIILGGGKKSMFGELAAPQHLRLVEVRHFNGGFVLLHYMKDDRTRSHRE
jgi:dihydrofolate reductase